MPERVRCTARAALLALSLTLLGGCALGTAADDVPSPHSAASDTLPPEPASVAPPAVVAPEPVVAPAGVVVLASHAVHDVHHGTPDPEARLVALLGEPSERQPPEYWEGCGSGFVTGLAWGDLTVQMDGGDLYGWSVGGRDVPDGVVLPYGVRVGDPISAVTAATRAQPEPLGGYDFYVTYAEGLRWFSDTDDPLSPVTLFGSRVMLCD